MPNLTDVDYEYGDLDLYGSRWYLGIPVFTFFFPDKQRCTSILKLLDNGWSLGRACGLYEVETWRFLAVLKRDFDRELEAV